VRLRIVHTTTFRYDEPVSEAYMDVVARFLGEDKPLRFVDPQKAGLLKRLFGRK